MLVRIPDMKISHLTPASARRVCIGAEAGRGASRLCYRVRKKSPDQCRGSFCVSLFAATGGIDVIDVFMLRNRYRLCRLWP